MKGGVYEHTLYTFGDPDCSEPRVVVVALIPWGNSLQSKVDMMESFAIVDVNAS